MSRIIRYALIVGLTACVPQQTVRPTPAAAEPVTAVARRAAATSPPPIFWIEAPIAGDPSPVWAQVPRTGVVVEDGRIRLLRPSVAETPRRVAIQTGHWRTDEAPAEFPRLRFSSGGEAAGIREVDVTRDVAERVAAVLTERGIVVDMLPATVPPSYLADVFVALHADADATGTARGFKIAHGSYRSPEDERLVGLLTEHYAAGTGLPRDRNVTTDMTDYYAFAWFRYEHALAPHTAAAIMELGFISHPEDRSLLVDQPDLVARSVAEGIIRFLDAVPRSELFGEDIIIPQASPRP